MIGIPTPESPHPKAMSSQGFRESNLFGAPIRDLGLKIAGTRLEPVIDEFRAELAQRNIRVVPRFHLSTEWGVPFGTVVIGIPFYLAHPDLTELHGEQVGHIEGFNRTDILRYLRHEMGHVVNYAYRLYDREAWVKLFGSITQPYREEYRPQPFSRRFVRHLPGWYAQKHPDEDWSETFAVWMTPQRDWRADYAQLPTALAKLEYCARTLAELGEPIVTATELDEDVSGIHYSLAQYYESYAADSEAGAAGLDGDLRAIFDDLKETNGSAQETRPAAELIRRHERQLMANVFRWTGHFPEKTRSLVRHLAKRAEALKQVSRCGGRRRRRRDDARDVARDELRASRRLFSGSLSGRRRPAAAGRGAGARRRQGAGRSQGTRRAATRTERARAAGRLARRRRAAGLEAR
jgi:hypothetical protein